MEVLLPAHPRVLLEDWNAHFLRGARIDRRFVNHDHPTLHVAAHRFAGTHQRPEVGLVRRIYRRGHRDDDEIRLRERRRIASHRELAGSAQLRARHFAGGIDEPSIVLDLGLRQIEAHGFKLLAELDRERQTDVSKANDGNYGHDFTPRVMWKGTNPALTFGCTFTGRLWDGTPGSGASAQFNGKRVKWLRMRPATPSSAFSSNIARIIFAIVAALAAGLVPWARAGGADLTQTIERVKPSIVGVGTFLKVRSPAVQFVGTGFVVADGRHVVTNAHVVARPLDTEKKEIHLVLVSK